MDALLQRADLALLSGQAPGTQNGWSWRDGARGYRSQRASRFIRLHLVRLVPYNVRLHTRSPLSFVMRAGPALQEAFSDPLTLFDAHWRCWLSLSPTLLSGCAQRASTDSARRRRRALPRLLAMQPQTGRQRAAVCVSCRATVDKPGLASGVVTGAHHGTDGERSSVCSLCWRWRAGRPYRVAGPRGAQPPTRLPEGGSVPGPASCDPRVHGAHGLSHPIPTGKICRAQHHKLRARREMGRIFGKT